MRLGRRSQTVETDESRQAEIDRRRWLGWNGMTRQMVDYAKARRLQIRLRRRERARLHRSRRGALREQTMADRSIRRASRLRRKRARQARRVNRGS